MGRHSAWLLHLCPHQTFIFEILMASLASQLEVKQSIYRGVGQYILYIYSCNDISVEEGKTGSISDYNTVVLPSKSSS